MASSTKQKYHLVRDDVLWLHFVWSMYLKLFGYSKKRVDLLNKCADRLFFIIQRVTLNEIIMCICRLNEKEKVLDKHVLSLEQLFSSVNKDKQQKKGRANFSGVIKTLRRLLDDLHKSCAPFKEWRHKTLAHTDLKVALSDVSKILPGINRSMIDEILTLMQNFMNTIARNYNITETWYGDLAVNGVDVNSMIYLLKIGVCHKEISPDMEELLREWEES